MGAKWKEHHKEQKEEVRRHIEKSLAHLEDIEMRSVEEEGEEGLRHFAIGVSAEELALSLRMRLATTKGEDQGPNARMTGMMGLQEGIAPQLYESQEQGDQQAPLITQALGNEIQRVEDQGSQDAMPGPQEEITPPLLGSRHDREESALRTRLAILRGGPNARRTSGAGL